MLPLLVVYIFLDDPPAGGDRDKVNEFSPLILLCKGPTYELNPSASTVKVVFKIEVGWIVKIPLEFASGFEMRIVSIVLRLALREISHSSYPDGLVIDEGFSSADKTHRAQLPHFLQLLRTRAKWILLISHMEELESLGDHILTLEQNENVTSIV